MTISNLPELHRRLRAAGIPIHQAGRDGTITFRAGATLEQQAHAAQIAAEMDDAVLLAVRRIKSLAQARIYAFLPAWKQANLTARAVELTPKVIAGTLTKGETAEFAAMQAAWARVKAIRAFSNGLEARVIAGETFDPAGESWP